MVLDFSDWHEAEQIKCYGINSNRENRLKDCTITNEDILLNLNAQELIDSI